jgi:murein DD-endopeptidase MepM/ murein hydrolase activator NlpD
VPSSDTTAPSPRLVRLVLLVALTLGLGGLALPSGSSAATRAGTEAASLHVPVFVQPVVVEVPRVSARATRAVHRALWVRPVSAPVNSPYGPRWGSWHPGLDFAAHYGAPIHVVGDGVVIGAGYLSGESGYGQIVLVRHAPGVITAYAHMSRVLARPGQRVHAGDTLGLVGATGHVTGPHLHFEVRLRGAKVNPRPWLRAHGIYV